MRGAKIWFGLPQKRFFARTAHPAKGGISYADPANNAPSNGIVLDKTLLSDTTFTVESLLSYSLRNIPMAQKDYAATKATNAGEDGLYVWTYSGVQTIRYTHKPVKIRVNGEAGTTFSYNVVAGSDTTGTQTATIGADGTYTIDTTYYRSGYGRIRWSYADRDWNHGGSDANAAWREDDDKNFKAQRDRLSVMEVSMTKSDANERTYKVTYAGQTLLEKADDGTNVKTGNDFTLLVGLPGTVYALRVYDRLLTTAEKNRNKAVDILQKVGYDLAAFNAKNASERELLLVKAMSLDVETATLADFAPLDREPTGFETFYVQDGLVGLYDAFNTDEISQE